MYTGRQLIQVVCSVIKMLNVMAEQSPDSTRDVTQDFLTTGRAGRRNALPDILGEHSLVSTSDLPDRLQGLTTRGKSGYDNCHVCRNYW